MTTFERFEEWVRAQPPPHYNAGEAESAPEALVLQNRDELASFTAMLEQESERATAIEIGLANGATHRLWTLLYRTVISIDISRLRVGKCFLEMSEHRLSDAASVFIPGDSTDPAVLAKAQRYLHTPVNLLFIDGDHTYEGVAADHRLYAPLVAPGGLVAFHDAISPVTGVPQLLKELDEIHDVYAIVGTGAQGIAWYRKEAQ